MGPIQFEATILSDGTIPVPAEVRRKLQITCPLKVHVSLTLVDGIDDREPDEGAWEELARLPEMAFEGGPEDGSVNHDRYLYGDLDKDRGP